MAWEQKRRPASEYINRHKADRILARDHHICHVCGHGYAEQVDHIIPWAEWTRTDLSPHDQANLAPIHGTACRTCGAECHNDKTQAEAARGSQRRAQRRHYPTKVHPGIIQP